MISQGKHNHSNDKQKKTFLFTKNWKFKQQVYKFKIEYLKYVLTLNSIYENKHISIQLPEL